MLSANRLTVMMCRLLRMADWSFQAPQRSHAFRQGAVLIVCLIIIESILGSAAHADTTLLGVRFGPGQAKTRVVLDLAGAPEYRVSASGEDKGQIIIDFDNMSSDADGLKGFPGKGHIASYRYGPNGRGQTRLLLELKRTAKVKEVFLIPPSEGVAKHRLVIDFQTASKEAFLKSLPDQVRIVPAARPKPSKPVTNSSGNRALNRSDFGARIKAPSLKPVARRDVIASLAVEATPTSTEQPSTVTRNRSSQPALRPSEARSATREAGPPIDEKSTDSQSLITIVIDPGHGGSHPGAVGPRGTLEKDVNLEAAKELAKMLADKKHYRVVLTRDSDVRVDLARRAEIARRYGADVFLSLHADGNNNKDLRGSSVYTLSEKGAKRSFQEAQDQQDYVINDRDFSQFDPEVGAFMFDVAQSRTRSESTKLANILLQRLGRVAPLVKNAKRTEDLKVLLRPDVPAVLVEMAFISNLDDEKNLRSPAWRKRIMKAVAEGIDQYFAARARADPLKRAGQANVPIGTPSP